MWRHRLDELRRQLTLDVLLHHRVRHGRRGHVSRATEAELSGLRAFDRATAEYDGLSARESTETSTGYASEIRWGEVRDRYRLFLAYPEAVVRWPELAALARDRAEKIDELVVDLAQMQQLEIEAEALAEAAKAEKARDEQRPRRRTRLDLGTSVDCNLGSSDW